MMWHKLIIVGIVIICLFTAGCSDSRQVILPSKLSDTEKELFNAIGIRDYAVYDVNVEGLEVEELELWADYYKDGQFRERLFHSTSKINMPEDEVLRLVFSTFSPKPGTDEETWVISFGSTRLTKPLVRPKMNLATKFKSYTGEREVKKGKPLILGIFISGDSIGQVQQEVFEGNREAFNKLLENQHVYILYCSFN